MPKISDLLKNAPFFSSLAPEEIDRIIPLFNEERYKRGEYIFLEGDPANHLCILASGRVRIIKHSAKGKEMIVAVIYPGEIFGGAAIFSSDNPASAQAMEPSSVLKIPTKDFHRLLTQYPAIARETVFYLGEKLREAHKMMMSLVAERVEKRIAVLILKLAEKAGEQVTEGIRLNLFLTRQDIAEMTGTTVETAIRVISRFNKAGLIKTLGKKIVIANQRGLRKIAEEE